jgi:hypothetical protein
MRDLEDTRNEETRDTSELVKINVDLFFLDPTHFLLSFITIANQASFGGLKIKRRTHRSFGLSGRGSPLFFS